MSNERFTAEILINNKQAESTLKKMVKDRDAAVEAQKRLYSSLKNEDKEAARQMQRSIDEQNRRIREQQRLIKGLGTSVENVAKSSYRDLQNAVKVLNKELRSGHIEKGSLQWEAMTAKIRECRAEMARMDAATQASKSTWSRFFGWLNTNWGAMVQIIGAITTLRFTMQSSVKAYADMEEAMADTRKYTGLADEQIRELNEDLKKMDTRTSREELNELAGAAGRLGKTAKDDILEFVEAGNMIKVALGDDLGDGAIDRVGKLAMAFGEDERMGLRGAMLATGSAVNELAQNSSSKAGYLIDFTARVAGFAKQLGLTQSQLMGFAAVMDENLLQDEMAATAFGNMLTKMQTDTANFANIAGMSVKEFTKLLNEDANGAIIALAQNIKKADPQTMMKMFDDMHLDGSRAVAVLSTMADKIDDVRDRQNLAAQAYKEGVSVQEEYNTMNNTIQAQLDKQKKLFHENAVELGERLLPVMKYTISSTSFLVKGINELIKFGGEHYKTLLLIAGTLLVLNARQLTVIATTKLQILWNTRLAGSFKSLGAVIKANPWGLAITAMTTLVSLFAESAAKADENTTKLNALDRAHQKAAEDFDAERTKIDVLNKMVHNNSLSYDERKKKLEELKGIVPDYHADLDKEKGLVDDNTEALEKYLINLEKSIKLKAAQEELEEAYRKKRKLEKQQSSLNTELGDANTSLSAAKYSASADAQKLGTAGTRNLSKGMDIATKNAQDRVNDVKGQLDEVHKTLKETEKDISDLNKEISSTSTTVTTTGKGTGGGTNTNNTYKGAGGGGDKNDNERLKALKEADAKEKAEMDRHLAENILSYQAGEQNYLEYLDNMHKIQEEGLKARMNVWGKETSEHAKYEKQLAALQLNGEQERNSMKLSALEREHEMVKAQMSILFNDENSQYYQNEIALNEALFQEDVTFLQKKASLYREGSRERMEVEMQTDELLARHQLEKQEYYQQLLSEVKEKWLTIDASQRETREITALNELHAQGLLSEEQYQKALAYIRAQYAPDKDMEVKGAKALDAAKKNAGVKTTDAGNNAVTGFASITNAIANQKAINEKLKEMYGEDYENNKEYQEAKRQLDQETMNQIVAGAQAAYSTISQFISAASAYAQACSDLEVAKITKNYDTQIAAAGKNEKKKEKLEKEKQIAVAKAKNEANKKAMKIEIAQAIASAAMAAINSYASAAAIPVVGYILAPIAAAMAIAAGAMQIATIKKQHEAEAAGYYEGGYTGGKRYRKEAGVVHEGEFVANHMAVNNPQLTPLFDLIDRAQRNNTVGSLTADDVSRQLGQGSTVAPFINVNTDNEELRGTIDGMNGTIGELVFVLKKGIKAYSVIDGPDGVKHQLDIYDKLTSK